MNSNEIIIEIRNLKKYYYVSKGVLTRSYDTIKAVDGVDLNIRQGQTLGLVGESGCGKSTLGRVAIHLDEPTSGEVVFDGENIFDLDKKKGHHFRQKTQIIFQDPYSSLNPRKTVGSIIEEPLIVHHIDNKSGRIDRVARMLKVVGLLPEHYSRYPHEFSGGQRQRIGIARALILNPKFVVCDEPVSALDVSIQSQIINLLEDLQEEFGLTYLFISHDLTVVEHISDEIAVMYLGRIVEFAESSELYFSPYHPYSEALLSASPVPDPSMHRSKIILTGDVPNPMSPPLGCHFSTRCPYVADLCREEPPPPWEEVSFRHWVRCWRVREIRQLEVKSA
jgi:oligopeptide transport system ATP-binding protein